MKISTAFLVAVFFCASVFADVPQLMSYQGYLTDNAGTPINGDRAMVFKLFAVPSGGTVVWTQSFSLVTVTNGAFSVILDVSSVEFTQQYYMEITVDGEVQTPRMQLTSAPYSLGPWSAVGNDVYYNHGNVGIGGGVNTLWRLSVKNDGTANTYAVAAENTLGTAAVFTSGLTVGNAGYPVPTAVFGKAKQGGWGGFFSADDDGYGLVGQSQGTGRAIWGWAFGTGYSGYFSGGAGVKVEGDVNVNGRVKIDNATIRSGTGNPEGSVIGNVGDLFLRTDGGAGSTMYVKESGNGTNMGWAGK